MAYEDFDQQQLILRDRLALDRTHLANERTLLAYARTAFMLVVAGATAVKALPDDHVVVVTGWAFVILGLGIGVLGARRFAAMRRRIKADSPVQFSRP